MAAVIRFDRLSCGLPICTQTSDESKLFSISVWINAGSARDPVGKRGLAHLCEHLLLRPLACTHSRTHRILLKTGALLNAYTDPEWVVISAQAPVEQSTFLIDLLSMLVQAPYCEPDGMAAEKAVILQELWEAESGPAETLSRTFRESAFAENPYVQPVGGTPETLKSLRIRDVQNYYTQFLNASKILITAHGDTRNWDLIAVLDEAFKDFPETSVSPDSPKNEPAPTAQILPGYRPVRIHKDVSNAGSGYGVLAGFSSVPRRSEKYWMALAFELFMADGPGSLLFQWLRDERLWMYGAVSMTEAFSNWGSQYFLMRISHDQIEEVLQYLGRQWQALPEFVTDERVEALKNQLASRALASLANLQDRMTLMRDTVLAETGRSGTLEGGLEAIVTHHARELNSDNLLSYIRQYAEWDRVSLVCAPI